MPTPAQPVRVAFQGELGAHAEDAIVTLYGDDGVPVPLGSYALAADALAAGSADLAMLPIENTLTGSLTEVLDLIDRTPALVAVGEVVIDVHYALVAPRGATVDSIATVLSHGAVLAQCQAFFRAHPRIQAHGSFDMAAAAREVAQLGDPSFAAVSGRSAAVRYELDVIAANIEDRSDNQTRFLVFAPHAQSPGAGTPVRTFVAFTTEDVPGALLRALQPFAAHAVNLRRIDTRPAGSPWTYRFFVEFDHGMGDMHAAEVVRDLATVTTAMRVVGTYPRWKAGRRGSAGWMPADVPVIA